MLKKDTKTFCPDPKHRRSRHDVIPPGQNKSQRFHPHRYTTAIFWIFSTTAIFQIDLFSDLFAVLGKWFIQYSIAVFLLYVSLLPSFPNSSIMFFSILFLHIKSNSYIL